MWSESRNFPSCVMLILCGKILWFTSHFFWKNDCNWISLLILLFRWYNAVWKVWKIENKIDIWSCFCKKLFWQISYITFWHIFWGRSRCWKIQKKICTSPNQIGNYIPRSFTYSKGCEVPHIFVIHMLIWRKIWFQYSSSIKNE